jgi:hypothetical protein
MAHLKIPILLYTVHYTRTNKDWINMQPHDRTDLVTMYSNWLF